ncbi:MAG: MerR family transcriptional regulator [Pseudanabaenaceae cyanobacterium]
MASFHVKEVARRLGVNPQTLYFWERSGVIAPPARNSAGYRCYSAADLEQLAFVARAKRLGLTLAEIQDILTLKTKRSLTCGSLAERLNQKVQALQTQIAELQALHDELVLLAQHTAQQPHDRLCTLLDE